MPVTRTRIEDVTEILIWLAIIRALSLNPAYSHSLKAPFPPCDKAFNATSRRSNVIYVQTRAIPTGATLRLQRSCSEIFRCESSIHGPGNPIKVLKLRCPVLSFPLPLRASRMAGFHMEGSPYFSPLFRSFPSMLLLREA